MLLAFKTICIWLSRPKTRGFLIKFNNLCINHKIKGRSSELCSAMFLLLSCSFAPPDTGFDWNWVEVRLEAKNYMCVPYGTEATVQGS